MRPPRQGPVAQLVAHLHGMQGVTGSSPVRSTRPEGTIVEESAFVPSSFISRGVRSEGCRAPVALPHIRGLRHRSGAVGTGCVGVGGGRRRSVSDRPPHQRSCVGSSGPMVQPASGRSWLDVSRKNTAFSFDLVSPVKASPSNQRSIVGPLASVYQPAPGPSHHPGPQTPRLALRLDTGTFGHASLHGVVNVCERVARELDQHERDVDAEHLQRPEPRSSRAQLRPDRPSMVEAPIASVCLARRVRHRAGVTCGAHPTNGYPHRAHSRGKDPTEA